MSKRYDIIINGGGIVGFTLLNLLLKSPHLNRSKILLIEQALKPATFRQPARHDQQSSSKKLFSNRVSSLTSASRSAFKKLGVWNTVEPYAHNVNTIKVWNYDYDYKLAFHPNDSSSTSSGPEHNIMFSVLENNRLYMALLDIIHKQQTENHEIVWASRLDQMKESLENGLVDITATNENGEVKASAPLILGCDGFNSKVRELGAIPYKDCDLKKSAVVGTVRMLNLQMGAKNNIAYQRFSSSKDTVAALLPLDNEFSSFVISAPNDYSKQLMTMDNESFIVEFNRLLSEVEHPENSILAGVHECINKTYDNVVLRRSKIDSSIKVEEPPRLESVVDNSRASFPLRSGTTSPRMVTSISGDYGLQIALLGDSSHRVHPLAGQGLNLGIQDAVELVTRLEQAAQTGERIFHDAKLLSKALKLYEIRRQAYIVTMSNIISSMQNLFKLSPPRFIAALDKCSPIKAAMIKVANGT